MAVISSATQVIPPAETRVANSQFTSQKIAQLDIIRGIAAVSVVYIHYGNYTSLVCFPGHEWIVKTVEVLSKIVQALSPQGGWAYSGVLIFICLSGFCIHLPNAGIGSGFDNGTGGGFSLKHFALRRFFRIYPPFAVALLLGLLCHLIVFQSNDHQNNIWIIQKQDSVRNMLFSLSGLNALLPGLDYPIGNVVLYTVIAEMWLYCLYPPILWIVRRRFGWFCVLAVALCLSIMSMAPFSLGRLFGWARSVTCEFLFLWWAGAFAAECYSRNIFVGKYVRPIWIGAVIVYLIINYFAHFQLLWAFSGPSFGVLCAVFLFAIDSIFSGKSIFSRCFGWIGIRSYSLYAIHWPIMGFSYWILTRWGNSAPYILWLFPLLMVAAVTILAYECVEKPSQAWARKLASRGT